MWYSRVSARYIYAHLSMVARLLFNPWISSAGSLLDVLYEQCHVPERRATVYHGFPSLPAELGGPCSARGALLPAVHHRLHMSIRPPGTDPARARLDTTRTSRAWPGTLLTRAVPVRITCQDMCPSTAQRGTKRAGLARKPLGHSGPCPPLARKSQNYKKSKILKF